MQKLPGEPVEFCVGPGPGSSIRLMANLRYLKATFSLGDKELVQGWSKSRGLAILQPHGLRRAPSILPPYLNRLLLAAKCAQEDQFSLSS